MAERSHCQIQDACRAKRRGRHCPSCAAAKRLDEARDAIVARATARMKRFRADPAIEAARLEAARRSQDRKIMARGILAHELDAYRALRRKLKAPAHEVAMLIIQSRATSPASAGGL